MGSAVFSHWTASVLSKRALRRTVCTAAWARNDRYRSASSFYVMLERHLVDAVSETDLVGSRKRARRKSAKAGRSHLDNATDETPRPGEAATPLYLTPEQVAFMMQVSPKTVYRLAATDPSLPATRFGRAVRFRADLLEHWLAARTQRSRRLTHDQRGGLTTSDTSTAA